MPEPEPRVKLKMTLLDIAEIIPPELRERLGWVEHMQSSPTFDDYWLRIQEGHDRLSRELAENRRYAGAD